MRDGNFLAHRILPSRIASYHRMILAVYMHGPSRPSYTSDTSWHEADEEPTRGEDSSLLCDGTDSLIQ